jgi:endonuclease/exonuclease/phosphatase (EEP) superfamily protein YafD
VHWNVARPDALLPRAAAWLRAQDADILCLAEAQPRGKRTLDRWRAELPDYKVQESMGEMLCLVRGEVIESRNEFLTPGSFAVRHRLKVRGQAVNVLQIDIDARPGRSRRAAMDGLQRLAALERDGNLIIAGDFNLPRESAFLDSLRSDFRQSFEASGRGFAETWPLPLLALSLDQVWTGRAWQPQAARHGWNWLSDHRPVVVEIAPR